MYEATKFLPCDVHLIEFVLKFLRLSPVQSLVLHVEHTAVGGLGLGAHLQGNNTYIY